MGMNLRHSGLGLLFCASALGLRAHDPGLSTTQAVVRSDRIELSVGYSPADVRALLRSGGPAVPVWKPADFALAEPELAALAPRLWTVRAGPTAVTAAAASVRLESGNSVRFLLTYAWPGAGPLTLTSGVMDALPPGHRDYLIAADENGKTLVEVLVDARTGPVTVPFAAAARAVRGAAEPAVPVWAFLRLGILHIWTGYDHLLFLFGLLVVCRSFRSILGIISCFTIAHSLTLGLSTLNVVTVPSRIIEPMIAASILYVGIENLARRGAEPVGRWALTFAFGLVHGFGFASVLRELGVGSQGQGIAIPLFTFNLGVEIGQVAIAAAVLPIVWHLRQNPAFIRRGVPVLSVLVASAGLYWLMERTVFA
jgi:hydrogenase/urease accessory protein HupE